MTDPAFWHRVQFGFTLTFHYIFPQLTMGLALLIVVLKVIGRRFTKRSRNVMASINAPSSKYHPSNFIADALARLHVFYRTGKK